jgi:hypothetical protein
MRTLLQSLGWVLLYGLFLTAATVKISSMSIPSYDPYFYSYLASGEDVATFKLTPGLPASWAAIPDEKIIHSRGFFTVKPLYVALTRAAVPLMGIFGAPFFVSTVAYFCLGWVVWLWLRAFGVPNPWRILAALLLMFSFVFTIAARQGNPDMLCTLLLVTGAWLLFSTRLPHLGALVLLTSVFARTDCLVLGGLLLLLAAWRRRISPRAFILWAGVMLLSEFWVASHGYPYRQFVSESLVTSYFYALTHGFAKSEVALYTPFVLLALVAVKLEFYTDLVFVCLASWVIRYLLLPKLEVRYLLPQAAILGIVAAGAAFRPKVVIPQYPQPEVSFATPQAIHD